MLRHSVGGAIGSDLLNDNDNISESLSNTTEIIKAPIQWIGADFNPE